MTHWITSRWKFVFAAFTALLLTACEGDTRELVNTVNAAKLRLVSVQFSNLDNDSIIAEGATRLIVVTGTNDSGESGITLPSLPIFTSSNSSVVSIDRNGNLSANQPGEAVITANYGGLPATASVRVDVLLSIRVEGDQSPDVCRTSTDISAIGTFESGEESDISGDVIWTATSNARVEYDNGTTEYAVRNTSQATITATSETSSSISGQLEVTGVDTITNVTVAPTQAEVSEGNTTQFTATGQWTDVTGSETVTSNINWTATTAPGTTGSATIDENGEATGVSQGTVNIVGACEEQEGTATLIVLPPPTIVALEFYQGDVDDPDSQITTSFEIDLLTTTPIFMLSRLRFSDNTYEDVTNTTEWSSSDSAVVQVGNLVPTDSNTDERTYKGALTGLQPSLGTQINISYSQGGTNPNTNSLQIVVNGTAN